MKDVIENEKCCGCGACQIICPKNAIQMLPDNKGFLHPSVNEDSCVNCGLCKKVCCVVKANDLKNENGSAHGAYNTDSDIRNNSTSGGVFSALAYSFIREGGIVFGAASINNSIVHIKAEVVDEVKPMRGSKYVQSNISNCYLEIERLLRNEKRVLFSGTPCQCAALKSYLIVRNIKIDNLCLVDLVCHGVCSPKVFKDYIEFCNSRNGHKIVEHRFREKTRGWVNHTEMNYFDNGVKDYESFDSQLFKSIFYSHYAIRESCFNCQFTTTQRTADITMADFWGLKNKLPEHFDENGVSFILTNTKKGEEYLRNASDMLNIFKANITDTEQPHLYHPCNRPKNLDKFWRAYNKGFNHAMVKYFHAGKIRRLVTDSIRAVIKKRGSGR